MGTENRTNQVDMKLLRLLTILLAVVALSCKPEELPDGNNDKENTENGNNDGPDVPEQPKESYYVKVDEDLSDWSGDYLITYTSRSEVLVLNSYGDTKGYGTDISSKVTSQGIHSNDGDQYKATVSKVGDGYSVNVANIGYIGLETSANSLSKTDTQPSSSDTKYLWKFSYKNGGSVWMTSVAHDGRRLQWNANENARCFRCYTGSQNELTFYRRGISTGGNTGGGNGGNTGGNESGDGNEDDDDNTGGSTTPTPDPGQGEGNEGGNEGGDSGEIPAPVPGQSGKYGWYELPAISYSESGKYLIDQNNTTLYYAHHICAGGEKGPGGKTARNYTVCFSAEHHVPVWVAAPRHKMYSGNSGRNDSYKVDPNIPSSIQYSSKSTGGGCNKGHMLGSAERTSSVATNKQVFYYSNIAPQLDGTFNTGGGGWNKLEDWIDGKVCSDTLYVVIGAYFDKYTDKRGNTVNPKKISYCGRSDVSFPTMFYYILLRTKSGNSGKPLSKCSANEIQCAAFVRSHHASLKGQNVNRDDLMSVSDLEKITGFTYFPNVPQAPKSSYNASDWGL